MAGGDGASTGARGGPGGAAPMPAMPTSGGGGLMEQGLSNLLAGVAGAPGPGNDYSINFTGNVGNFNEANDFANSVNIPRMRQVIQPLP